MLDRISFVIGEALMALRRHRFLTFSAITQVAISLYFLGGLGFTYRLISQQAATVSSQFELYVYVKQDDSGGPHRISDTAAALRKIDGVSTVTLVPRDAAWALEKQKDPQATQGVEFNPLPDSFKITFTDIAKADAVADAARNIPTLDPNNVKYLQREQQFVSNILRFIGWLSSAGLVLLFIAGTLIFNTVQQAIQARAQEIRIMSLVGASRWMIGFPFLIEGLVHGTVGGLIGGVLVWRTYEAIQTQLVSGFGTTAVPFPVAGFLELLAGVGAAYGVICSVLALRFRNRA